MVSQPGSFKRLCSNCHPIGEFPILSQTANCPTSTLPQLMFYPSPLNAHFLSTFQELCILPLISRFSHGVYHHRNVTNTEVDPQLAWDPSSRPEIHRFCI